MKTAEKKLLRPLFFLAAIFCFSPSAQAQLAGAPSNDELIIARDGATQAAIVVAPDAGKWETQAAADLALYIGKMSGATPAVWSTPEAVAAALQARAPVFFVGAEAIKNDPNLQKQLDAVAKPNPVLRADAIVVRRAGNRVLLAGTNDESHYFAVAYLLKLWGCRWYLPGELGECVPEYSTLKVGTLDFIYAPPFEMRRALNRNSPGVAEWEKRNMMNSVTALPQMGALHLLTKDIVPQGKTVYNVPFSDDATIAHIVQKIEARYAMNAPFIPLAAFIGEYSSDSLRDNELRAGIVSKYQGTISSTDAMLEMYNKVAKTLREKYPASKTKLIGISYASVALPPQRAFTPEPSLIMWLVPVDIDPNHAMDDDRSPSRSEWRAMMERWTQVMQGRVAIYDYEQPMLVWRDLPNPTHHVFARDVKIYRDAGIIGFSPETRGSLALNFLNVFFRGQLMWDPDTDVEAELNRFFPAFYGPAAPAMSRYHSAIFEAWNRTIVTEHEYFIAPAIYSPALVNTLRRELNAAAAALRPLQTRTKLKRDETLYLQRFEMARVGFDILDNYMAMVRAGASDGDYKSASEAGRRGLASVLALAKFNPALTPMYDAKLEILEPGGNAALWPGEVQQYIELQSLTDGTKGVLIAKTPLEWAFRRDPHDTGLASGWAYAPLDLSFWQKHALEYSIASRKDYPTTQWEMLRTDLYMQAQGVRHADGQSFTGHAWYRSEVEVAKEQAKGKVHLRFPGVFNECWLYVNGSLVAHRPQKPLWAQNDYRFEWDADISSEIQPGRNTIALRLYNPMYLGGIFRRPFLYAPVPQSDVIK